MEPLNFRQLIDLAIGSPEPGHVNFYALHCLLFSFAEKLEILDETVDCSQYGNASIILSSGKGVREMQLFNYCKDISPETGTIRIRGGADPEDEGDNKKESDESQQPIPEKDGQEVEAIQPEASQPEPPQPEETQPEAAQPEETPPQEEPVDDAAIADVADAPIVTSKESIHEPLVDAVQASSRRSSASVRSDVRFSLKSSKEKLSELDPARESLSKIETRLSFVEMGLKAPLTEELKKGAAIMKDQLQIIMEEMRILTNIVLNNKTDSTKTEKLRQLSYKLRSIQKDNTFIEGTHRFDRDDELSIGTIEEMPEDGSASEEGQSETTVPSRESEREDHNLLPTIIYSPTKMLDQILELKSELCVLSNKVNHISASMLEQDCQRTMIIIQELQEQLRDLKYNTKILKDAQEHLQVAQSSQIASIDEINDLLEGLAENKLDKSEIDILLADKVNFAQLQRKVSHEQYQELQCCVDKQIGKLNKMINVSERNMMGAIENVRSTLGSATINELLNKFKNNIDKEIKALNDVLKHYIDSTNDECAAAGARIKVLQDLACVSCDTTCVMRTIEKAKVGKLPNAHASATLGPLVTYELGSIRKSGVMGYYHKDQFPHSPNAWMQRQSATPKPCVPRHAGGSHTTHTAKEHVDKVLLKRKP